MKKPTRTPSPLRSHDAMGWYGSDDSRYLECARLLLHELEQVVAEVKSQWLLPLNETLRNSKDYPGLTVLVHRRDMLSNSVRIFSAMAVEAFLNYYGVVRLGEEQYKDNFERLGIVPKLKTLVLVCDSIALAGKDPLVKLLDKISKQRNDLVHPKASELPGYIPAENLPGIKVPEFAQQTLKDVETFFVEFVSLIPAASHLVPNASKYN